MRDSGTAIQRGGRNDRYIQARGTCEISRPRRKETVTKSRRRNPEKRQGLRLSQIRTADGTKQRVWIGKILRSWWMRMTSGSGCEAKSSTLAAGPSRSQAQTRRLRSRSMPGEPDPSRRPTVPSKAFWDVKIMFVASSGKCAWDGGTWGRTKIPRDVPNINQQTNILTFGKAQNSLEDCHM